MRQTAWRLEALIIAVDNEIILQNIKFERLNVNLATDQYAYSV